MPDTRMTQDEREDFLAAPRIGVVSIPRTGGQPLSAPVWYEYTKGGALWFLTGPMSMKGKLLGLQTPVTLVAQQEEMPYAYVSVECTVADMRQASDDESLHMATRYLGKENGIAYTKANSGSVSIKLTLQPHRWLSVDYAKMSLGE